MGRIRRTRGPALCSDRYIDLELKKLINCFNKMLLDWLLWNNLRIKLFVQNHWKFSQNGSHFVCMVGHSRWSQPFLEQNVRYSIPHCNWIPIAFAFKMGDKKNCSNLRVSNSDLRSELCKTRSCRWRETVSRTQSMNRSKSETQNSWLSRNEACSK